MKLLKLYFPLCLSIFFFASCQDSNQDTDPILDNVCVQFDISALVAAPEDDHFVVSDNKDFSIDFESFSEAETALQVIRLYQLNEYCTIGENNSFAYFLSDGDIATDQLAFAEDCISFQFEDLRVELVSSGKYTVVDNGGWHYAGESEDEANQILQVIRHYQATSGCYVGRPDTDMHYLRR